MNRSTRRKNQKKFKKLIFNRDEANRFLIKQGIKSFSKMVEGQEIVVPVDQTDPKELKQFLRHNYGITLNESV